MGRSPLSRNFQVLKTVPVLKAALCPQTPQISLLLLQTLHTCTLRSLQGSKLCEFDLRVDSILELKVYQAYYNAVNIGIFSLTKGLEVRVGGRKLRTA